jgi:hypothetical protein
MARNTDYVKHTSYSPRQHVALPPIKAFSNKLRINSYYPDGRNCGPSDTRTTAPRPEQSWHDVKLRDTGE